MSRETDSSSSGPNGRGGAAYPSGTPPYGTPQVTESGADAGRSAAGAPPEERKTETTLTTRIRINIPGSRPIPPVVVRTPVTDTDVSAEGADSTGGGPRGGAEAPRAVSSPTGGPAVVEAPAGAAPAPAAAAAEEKTSDWFAPRKSGAPKGGPGGGSTNGAGLPGGSGPAGAAGPAGPQGSGGPGAGSGRHGAPGGARPGGNSGGNGAGPQGAPGGARPGGANAPRPGGTNGAGLPGATGAGPVAPGHGGGTGSFDVSGALRDTGSFPAVGSGNGNGNGTGNGTGEQRRDDLPYFADFPDGGRRGPGNGTGPSGPTGGPVTGDGPLVPPMGPGVAPGSLAAGPGGPGRGPGGPGMGQGGPGAGPGGPGMRPGGPGGPPGGPGTGSGYPGGGPGGPGGPTGPGGPGGPGASGYPGSTGSSFSGGLSDDTAILTPQKPAPEPGAGGYGGAGENVSGHTLTSGIPVVPGTQNSPFGPGAHPDGPLPHTPPKLPEPVQEPAPAARRSKKKGRSKLVLLGVGVFVIGGGAYGAGLLMNHSDVPKGTTVLGVDIGGGTRDEAVKKLDDAFGDRTNQALKLSVDGDTVSLKPDQAGLQLDTQATVRAAAGSDYNPVSVIGSLFGQERVVEPAMPVDEEKLKVALESAAGGSGSASDGTIKFESGKAVAVYGKAGKGIDVASSTQAVQDAYRAQVETGTGTAVKVATATQQPTVTNAEVDREMKAFAQPAMSDLVTVQTDATHTVSFSPENTLWKFIAVKAVDGKLTDTYDLDALKELYGNTFDGVTIARANGEKTAVTPQDVVGALRPALLGKTAADRIGVIETNPS
ncbi:hypothetical protein OG548_15260 [Streptomyces sp. NBC_01356]|uniref:hypothetical protein n=1 Tax=Streptomyces sp. NBC_01356 TaxID=2903836 RepID=UPI002E37AAB5|nr:hypothetical protein [Streptomyces sp. NBC_01356]